MKNYHFSLVVRKAFVNSIPLHMFFPFLKEGRHRGFTRGNGTREADQEHLVLSPVLRADEVLNGIEDHDLRTPRRELLHK